MSDRAELAAWLALLAAPGLRAPRVLELVRTHGSARETFRRLGSECGPELAAAARTPRVRDRVVRALAAIDGSDIRPLTVHDPAYPRLLQEQLELHAPPVLFARGDLSALDPTALAVVGCRAATEYGLDIAEQIGGAVARAGGCVVSGLALGIDAAAHTAALDAGGPTIAVLGCGVDVYYPPQNMALQDRIARHGLLLSEFLPGEPPRRHQFPHRNRVIAALGAAVVVVEAGEKSGALSTARHAAGCGIEVYAVPNAVDQPTMQGILLLHQENKVHTYTGVRDLLESTRIVPLGRPIPEPRTLALAPAPGGVHGRVWSVLRSRPLHVDAIATAAGVPVADALAILFELELDGRIRQLPGSRFVLPPPAKRATGSVAAGST
jgi:DNA processing protein